MVVVNVGLTAAIVFVDTNVPTDVNVEGFPLTSVVRIKLVPTLVMGISVVDVSKRVTVIGTCGKNGPEYVPEGNAYTVVIPEVETNTGVTAISSIV